MCLFTLNKEPFVAETDIVCYKLVQVEKKLNGLLKEVTTTKSKIKKKLNGWQEVTRTKSKKYRTIFKTVTLNAPDKHKSVNNYYVSTHNCIGSEEVRNYIIEDQGVHCYATYEDAESELRKYFIRNGSLKLSIVKCIIPKGTRYWRNLEYLASDHRIRGQVAKFAAERLLLYINN